MRRLMRELKVLGASPLEGIRIQLNGDSTNVLDVVCTIEGSGESCRGGTLQPGIDTSS